MNRWAASFWRVNRLRRLGSCSYGLDNFVTRSIVNGLVLGVEHHFALEPGSCPVRLQLQNAEHIRLLIDDEEYLPKPGNQGRR